MRTLVADESGECCFNFGRSGADGGGDRAGRLYGGGAVSDETWSAQMHAYTPCSALTRKGTECERSVAPTWPILISDDYGHRNRQLLLHTSALCTLHSARCISSAPRRPLPDHNRQLLAQCCRRRRVARGFSPLHLSLPSRHDKLDKHASRSTGATLSGPPLAHTLRNLIKRDFAPTTAAVACFSMGLHGGPRRNSRRVKVVTREEKNKGVRAVPRVHTR